jgi:hypothetical protein
MKTILIFDMPDDQDEFESAINGSKWQTAMYEMDQYLRSQLKYNDAGEDYDKIREELHNILENHNLSL